MTKSSLLTLGSKPKAMLTAATISLLAMSQDAEAGVTWLASDNGIDLTLTTSGTLNVGTDIGDPVDSFFYAGFFRDSETAFSMNGEHYVSLNGDWSGADPWVLDSTVIYSGMSGHTFGYNIPNLFWDSEFGASPGSITPITSFTLPGLTVADAFSTNLDAGPVIVWVHDFTGDTISVALVPEPSSSTLLGLGVISFLLRRRR